MQLSVFEDRERYLNEAKTLFKKRKLLCSHGKMAYETKEKSIALRLLKMNYSRKILSIELGVSTTTLSVWKKEMSNDLVVSEQPRSLSVVNERKKSIEPGYEISPIERCEICIGKNISINLKVSEINATLLREIRKAVE